MKYDLIIIRYGELALKTRYVRNYFETTLIRNIKQVFKKHEISCNIRREWGRIYLYTDQISQGVKLLRRIFGITSVSPAVETKTDMRLIANRAVTISKNFLDKEKTFAVETSREGKHDFTSQDVSIWVGNDIVKATNASVNLTKPDFKLFIEIRGDKSFIFTEKILGAGGLPLGTQGKTLALIDSIRSILAAWYIMRRGCKVIFVITEKLNEELIESFVHSWDVSLKLIYTDYANTKSKKNLYSTLNKIAFEQNCEAVVTGHSFYINSNDVLSDIKSMKKYIDVPVLHPLIAMDNEAINKKCREIEINI